MTLELHECADQLRALSRDLLRTLEAFDRLRQRAPADVMLRIDSVPGLEGLSPDVARDLAQVAEELQAEVDAMPEPDLEAAIRRERGRKGLTVRGAGLRLGTPPRVEAA